MAAPTKGEDAKRRVITMRVTNAGYDRIAAAAKANGRSVSQEIESRLELSFQEENIMGGGSAALATRLIGTAIALVQAESGKPWTDDRMTWEAVKAAADVTLAGFMPEIDFDIWERNRDTLFPFLDEIFKLDALRREIEGLGTAYGLEQVTEFASPEAKALYEKAWAEYPQQLQRVQDAARAVFAGPMMEHEQRRKAAVAIGRQMAHVRSDRKAGNGIIAGAMRMFWRSGAFEPLPGLKEPSDITDDEVFAFIRRLVGERADDPDMTAIAFQDRKPHWLDIKASDAEPIEFEDANGDD